MSVKKEKKMARKEKKERLQVALKSYRKELEESDTTDVAKAALKNAVPQTKTDVAVSAAIGLGAGALVAFVSTPTLLTSALAGLGIVTYNQISNDRGEAAKELARRPVKHVQKRLSKEEKQLQELDAIL